MRENILGTDRHFLERECVEHSGTDAVVSMQDLDCAVFGC